MNLQEYQHKVKQICDLISEIRAEHITAETEEEQYIIDEIQSLLEAAEHDNMDTVLDTLQYFTNQNVITGLIQHDNGTYRIKDHVLNNSDIIEYWSGKEWIQTYFDDKRISDIAFLSPVGVLARVRI